MAAAARATRSSTKIWLIGETISSFLNKQFPTNSEALKLFFFHKREQRLSTSAILATQFGKMEKFAQFKKIN